MNSNMISMVMLAVAALGFSPVQADGVAKAKRGGVVQKANDITYELVMLADGATIYVDDHGKPVAVTGASGKRTVLDGSSKSEAELQPVGDKLEARGIKLAPGSKVVATVTSADKKTVNVLFGLRPGDF